MSAGQGTKLVLVVIDGLTPQMLEASLDDSSLPTLAALAGRGTLARATTSFPSLTPVCLSSIATGAYPDVHEIPHLVWWHRGERRLVEYGSSFGAMRAAGLGRTIRDTLVGMNAEHLGAHAVTVFEALADAGFETAAVNFTAYRGRTLHRPSVPFLGPVLGPEQFFFYNLFRAERTGAPLSFRNRSRGSVDAYAAAVGRWLVTRDGFDFLLFYLSDYDFASHAEGPDAARAYVLFAHVESYVWGGEVTKAYLPFTQMLRWWDEHPEHFDGWVSIVQLQAGGLAPFAGVVVGLLATAMHAGRHRVPALAWFDC